MTYFLFIRIYKMIEHLCLGFTLSFDIFLEGGDDSPSPGATLPVH